MAGNVSEADEAKRKRNTRIKWALEQLPPRQRLIIILRFYLDMSQQDVGERLGIGYEDVRAVNPLIVYCSISGYGSDGPYRERPGYDTIGQAMGGLLGAVLLKRGR